MAYPDDPAMRVSHETIYQSIYLYPRGELRRELKACLRSGRAVRRRRGRRETRGGIVGAVPIGQRPPEVEGRSCPATTKATSSSARTARSPVEVSYHPCTPGGTADASSST